MSAPEFHVGQQVRISDRRPPVHHRVPSYAKGKIGWIERVCGMHGTPEKFIRGNGDPKRRLYRVRIPQVTLWSSYCGGDSDVLDIEIFEHWLEVVD